MTTWIDVNDELPPEDEDVLVCSRQKEVTVAVRFGTEWLNLIQSSSKYVDVIFWMHFPAPPESC
jgi:hypothetical protein